MTEELYIDGQAVDLKPDAATTLNYKSNLLGDISKITASNSQTIQCPKTPRNRKIFDNPGAPAYVSDRRYKRYSARLIRNGVEVVRVGYAVLLTASECYEIGLYWGVMANFQAWVDKAAKLNELDGTEALRWDKITAATALSTFKSQGYGYALYDCGVSNTDLTNIHPSATAWWILNKIASQAGFTFEMPEQYETALRTMAVPCLSRNSSSASNRDSALIGSPEIYNWRATWHRYATKTQDPRNLAGADTSIINNTGRGVIHLEVTGANGEKEFYIKAWRYLSTSPHLDVIADYDTRRILLHRFNPKRTEYLQSTAAYIYYFDAISVSIDTTSYATDLSLYFDEIREDNGYAFWKICAWTDWDDVAFPNNAYPLAKNLPEVTQIDFIKAICAMQGIFVVPDPTDANNLKFVSFDSLQTNKARALDWSDKLVRSNEDEPKTAEFKVNDYCRNNYFKYKEDDSVATNGDGNLTIASEILEKEKTVITLPFAASDGSSIPHYKLNDGGTGVETIKVKDRIMCLVNDGAGRAALTFDGMSFDILLARYYKSLSRLLNSAIATTEAIMLDEYDLKSLDYSVPFYLRQYGKYYGIVSIQSTANKACEVKAVQLPETGAEDDEPIDPSLIVNSISVRERGLIITAQYPLASDLTVKYNEYLVGDPTPYPRSLVFPKGETEIATGPDSRLHDRTELTSLTPASDDMYNYVIVQQSEEK